MLRVRLSGQSAVGSAMIRARPGSTNVYPGKHSGDGRNLLSLKTNQMLRRHLNPSCRGTNIEAESAGPILPAPPPGGEAEEAQAGDQGELVRFRHHFDSGYLPKHRLVKIVAVCLARDIERISIEPHSMGY